MTQLYENVAQAFAPGKYAKAGEYDDDGVSWMDYRAFLNGEDVSERCVEASEAEGWVKLLPKKVPNFVVKFDEDGFIVTELCHGDVRLVRKTTR